MSNLSLSQRGSEARLRRQKQAAGVPVTYVAKGGTPAPFALVVVPGLSVFDSTGVPGRVEVSARDYLVAVADLVAAGCPASFSPTLGDQLTEVSALTGETTVWEVANPKNGEPPVRYSSQDRVQWRCHCKVVSRTAG